MRAIDYLKRIRTIRGKIRCKEDELQELEKDMASIKAVDYGAVHTTGRPTDISDRIIKVCEMREEIQQQYDKLAESLRENLDMAAVYRMMGISRKGKGEEKPDDGYTVGTGTAGRY